ncbi:LINE-1 retrotransposable element ORF2 protein, partial [Varanus komodoensis]
MSGVVYVTGTSPSTLEQKIQANELRWLKPAVHSAEQVTELVLLEQFVTILSAHSETGLGVRDQKPWRMMFMETFVRAEEPEEGDRLGLPWQEAQEFYEKFRVMLQEEDPVVSKEGERGAEAMEITAYHSEEGEILKADSQQEVQTLDSKVGKKDQNGFLPKRQMKNYRSTILDILEYYETHMEKPMALLFLDAQKAFDNVNWQFMMQQMDQMEFGGKFMNAISSIYQRQSDRILINGECTRAIEIQKGARQGCPLSPLLFILTLEVLNRNIRADEDIKGTKIRDEKYKLQAFADDLVFIIEEPFVTIPKLLQWIGEYGEVTGMKINKEKTKLLVKNLTQDQKKRLQEQVDLQIVKKVKYLGICLTAKCTTLKEDNYDKLLKDIKVSLPELTEIVSDQALKTPKMLVLGDFNLHAKMVLTKAAQDFMVSMMAGFPLKSEPNSSSEYSARCATLKEDNYIKLFKEIKTDLEKWTNLQLSLLGRIAIVKMNILPKMLFLFQTIRIKIEK